MYWFTSDEHYAHVNIIRYCNRPFANVGKMNRTLINRHNALVRAEDTVFHLGDFSFGSRAWTLNELIPQLTGRHVFLRGSHDRWQLAPGTTRIDSNEFPDLLELEIAGRHITICHYPMRSWPRSFHGSWQLFGHGHGTLATTGLAPHGYTTKQLDVGVDGHEFAPWSFDEIVAHMLAEQQRLDAENRRQRADALALSCRE
jgi:calcineurin-like phosphoesterase family protein